jgi:hypothetical protein
LNTLENQTIYQCEYCRKRFLSKNGVKQHEEIYCYLSPIPKQKRLEKIKKCNHHFEMQYSHILGEVVMQPDHKECIHCGVWELEWIELKKEEEE